MPTKTTKPLTNKSSLKQAVQKSQTPLNFLISPETDSTWEERRKAVLKLQAEIDQRLEQRRAANVEWPDSTALLRKDRDMIATAPYDVRLFTNFSVPPLPSYQIFRFDQQIDIR